MKLRVLFFALLIFILPHSSSAVIQLKLTVSKMYTTSSPILLAKISSLNESNRSIEADVTETLVGQPTEKIRLQLIEPKSLFASLKIGDPIVLFAAKGRGAGDATIHLADTWLFARAKAESNPPIWQITQPQSSDFPKSFPGTTPALASILRDLKSGKTSLMEKAEERLFTEGASEVAQLKITPTALFTADLNGDKTQQLLISTPHGPRIFSTDKFEDLTQNISLPATGNLLAVGDLNSDGKPDLLIDNIPYLNQGATFKPAAPLNIPPKSELLAITIADNKVISLSKLGELKIGPDSKTVWADKDSPAWRVAILGPFEEGNKISAIVLTPNSLIRYSADGAASDFTRLTGENLSSYLKESDGKFINPKLIPLDANGDGRTDLLVLSEKASFLLINRGFGAFFVSPAAAQSALGSAPDKPFPYASAANTSHFAAIDTRNDHHQDLLILTPDGALYRLSNPPQK